MNIKSITYKNNHQSFILSLDQNKITYNNHTVPIDKELLLKYVTAFVHIIMIWQEDYIDTSVIDGANWQITINFLDNQHKIYSGHGTYPTNFEALERLISQIISEVF